MIRHRKTKWQRAFDRWLRRLYLMLDARARRRSEGGRKAAVTRRRNAEDTRIAENLERRERARVFGSDPTP
mgnify:CR=1 FL=1